MTEIKDPEAVLNALERAKAEAKAFREERDALKAQLEKASSWKDRALKAEVRSAISATGVKDPERVLKLVNLSNVDTDEDGNFQGVDDLVKELTESLPELFDKKRRASGTEDIFTGKPAAKEMNSSQRQAASILGA